jgi:phage portal protein BeeE
VKFEVDGLLRADARTRAEVYAKSLDPVTGWLTRAEVRRLEDLEPEPPAAPTVMDVVNQTTPPAGARNLSRACWTPTCGRS